MFAQLCISNTFLDKNSVEELFKTRHNNEFIHTFKEKLTEYLSFDKSLPDTRDIDVLIVSSVFMTDEIIANAFSELLYEKFNIKSLVDRDIYTPVLKMRGNTEDFSSTSDDDYLAALNKTVNVLQKIITSAECVFIMEGDGYSFPSGKDNSPFSPFSFIEKGIMDLTRKVTPYLPDGWTVAPINANKQIKVEDSVISKWLDSNSDSSLFELYKRLGLVKRN